MLRSLLVLGHLESVLNQYKGVSQSKPHLRSALAPVAVSAAWRLQRWDVLSGCLGQWESSIGSEDGRFEVALAKTLRAVAVCRASSPEVGAGAAADFARAVRAGRTQVMAGLAAASRESYQVKK